MYWSIVKAVVATTCGRIRRASYSFMLDAGAMAARENF